MSDFLNVMGSIDTRVRPLVFTIRKWACEVGLTNSSPGRWITNFSLTLLVLAFLQRPLSSPPVLPTLNSLIKQASVEDRYVTEDGINCSFLRDVNNLNETFSNNENLYELLLQFFQFCSEFDFATKAVSLNEGVAISKPDYSALYIVNPLERSLNVSKNVSVEELERLRMEARNAIWTLESQENRTGNWGILSLFGKKMKTHSGLNGKQKKLLDVSVLFEENNEQSNIATTVDNNARNVKNNTKSDENNYKDVVNISKSEENNSKTVKNNFVSDKNELKSADKEISVEGTKRKRKRK